MEILDSVRPHEVPEGARRITRFGLWTGLVQRAIADQAQGRVTVVTLADRDEYIKMRNGTADPFRKARYSRTFTVVEETDGKLRVYIECEPLGRPQPQTNGHARRPAANGIRPVRT